MSERVIIRLKSRKYDDEIIDYDWHIMIQRLLLNFFVSLIPFSSPYSPSGRQIIGGGIKSPPKNVVKWTLYYPSPKNCNRNPPPSLAKTENRKRDIKTLHKAAKSKNQNCVEIKYQPQLSSQPVATWFRNLWKYCSCVPNL